MENRVRDRGFEADIIMATPEMEQWLTRMLTQQSGAIMNQVRTMINELGQQQAQTAQQQAQTVERLNQWQAQSTPLRSAEREGGDTREPRLDERDFNQIAKFGGALAQWDEWRHSFCMVCGKLPELYQTMRVVINQAVVCKNVENIRLDDDERNEAYLREKFSLRLYRYLSLTTTGEAQLVVRGTESRSGGFQCGFVALGALVKWFNPRTPGRIFQHLGIVLNPPKIKDVRLLPKAVEEWEARRAKLALEYNEPMSNSVSIAVFIQMLPKDIQDFVLQYDLDEKITYQEVREKVVAIAGNRIYDMMPVPMEVGHVAEAAETVEVDAINGVCNNCGGWGHPARECPSTPGLDEGKGKGGKDGSGKESNQQNNGNPKNYGGKSSGKGKDKSKGFQGQCFRCKQYGHSAPNCRAPLPVNGVDEETVDASQNGVTEVANVGAGPSGRWDIAAVDKREVKASELGWQTVGSKRNIKVKTSVPATAPPPDLQVRVKPQQGKGPMPVSRVPVAISWAQRCMIGSAKGSSKKQEFVGSICQPCQPEVCGVSTDVTIDSAAEESVCPKEWGQQFGLQPVPEKSQVSYVNASGGHINHYGSRKVVIDSSAGKLGMKFQVTDVKKPLLAVARLCEHDNIVQFGPRPDDCFVQNISTGSKLPIERRGNSWVIPGKLACVDGF